MSGVDGKVALVTGAASGIGRASALALAGDGAIVTVADIDAEGGAETCRQILAAGGKARWRRLDVASEADWSDAVGELETRDRALHFLVNNAAICISAPLAEMSFASWKRQCAINLDGVFLGTQAAIPLMARSGGGSIVNLSSVAGLKGIPGLSGYCATKGAVRLFTKAVALECAQARNGVRVNSVHPGAIETPMQIKLAFDGAMPSLAAEDLAERMAAARGAAERATPLGFAGQPEDVASGVLYLCSAESRFVTGSELVIDGGALTA